jgi:hypothetical protein
MGSVGYEKDAARGRLTLIERPAAPSSAATLEVSYRLTAPRFDAAQWPNASDDQSPAVLTPPR